MKVRQRNFIKKGDVRVLLDQLKASFGEAVAGTIVPNKAKVERLRLDDGGELLAVNGELVLWKEGKEFIPLLTALLKSPSLLKAVTVDMGALKFVTNGADVMRPGVVSVDEGIEEGAIVKVVDERHHKPVAVGRALYDRDSILARTSGKVVKNLHTASDKLWKFTREFGTKQ
ncbi:MAG: PUA domain-containing protein [Promethearchaeota archaeon]